MTSVIGEEELDGQLYYEFAKEPYTLVELNGTALFDTTDPDYLVKYRSNRYLIVADEVDSYYSNDIVFTRDDGLQSTTNKDIYSFDEPFENIFCPTILGIKIEKAENGTAELMLEFVKPPYSSVSIGSETLAENHCEYEGNCYFISFNTLLKYANSSLFINISDKEGTSYPGFSLNFNSALEQGLRYLGISMDASRYHYDETHKETFKHIFQNPKEYSGKSLEDILGISNSSNPIVKSVYALQKGNVAKTRSYLQEAVNLKSAESLTQLPDLPVHLNDQTYPFGPDTNLTLTKDGLKVSGNWTDSIGIARVLNQDVRGYKYIKMDVAITGTFEDIDLEWGYKDAALKVEIKNGDTVYPLTCVQGGSHSTSPFSDNSDYIVPVTGTLYFAIPDGVTNIEQLTLVIGQAQNASVKIKDISFVNSLEDVSVSEVVTELDKIDFSYNFSVDRSENGGSTTNTFNLQNQSYDHNFDKNKYVLLNSYSIDHEGTFTDKIFTNFVSIKGTFHKQKYYDEYMFWKTWNHNDFHLNSSISFYQPDEVERLSYYEKIMSTDEGYTPDYKLTINIEKNPYVNFTIQDMETNDKALNIQLLKTNDTFYSYPGYNAEGSANFDNDMQQVIDYLKYVYSRNSSSHVGQMIDYLEAQNYDGLLSSELHCSGQVYSNTNYENQIRTMMAVDSELVLKLDDAAVSGYITAAISKINSPTVNADTAMKIYNQLQSLYVAFIPFDEIGGFGQKSMLVLYKLADYVEKGIIAPISITGDGELNIDSLPQQIGILQSTTAVSIPNAGNATIKYTVGEKTITYDLEIDSTGIVRNIKTSGTTSDELSIQLAHSSFSGIGNYTGTQLSLIFGKLQEFNLLDDYGHVTQLPSILTSNGSNYIDQQLDTLFSGLSDSSQTTEEFKTKIFEILLSNYGGTYFGEMNLDTDNSELKDADKQYMFARIYQALVSSGDPILQELFKIEGGNLQINNTDAINKLNGTGNFRSIDSEVMFFNKLDSTDPDHPVMTMIEDGKGSEPLALQVVFNKLANGELDPDTGSVSVKNYITDTDASWAVMSWDVMGTTNVAVKPDGSVGTASWIDDICNFFVNLAVQWALAAVGGWVINALNEAVKGVEIVQQAMAAVEWANNIKNTAESFIEPYKSAADIIETIKDPQKLLEGLIPKEITDIKKEVENNIVTITQTIAPLVQAGQTIEEQLQKAKEEIENNAIAIIKIGDQVIEGIDKEIARVEATINESGSQVEANISADAKKLKEYIENNYPEIDADFSSFEVDLVYPKADGSLPAVSDIDLSNLINMPKLKKETAVPEINFSETIKDPESNESKVVDFDISSIGQKITISSDNTVFNITRGSIPSVTIDGVEYSMTSLLSNNPITEEKNNEEENKILKELNGFINKIQEVLNNYLSTGLNGDIEYETKDILSITVNENGVEIENTASDFSNKIGINIDMQNGSIYYQTYEFSESVVNDNVTESSFSEKEERLIKLGLARYTQYYLNKLKQIFNSDINPEYTIERDKLTDPAKTQQLAVLCDWVYHTDEYPKVSDWQSVNENAMTILSDNSWNTVSIYPETLEETETSNGYAGAILINDVDKEIVMVHRGTEFLADDFVDMKDNINAYKGRSEQLVIAQDFLKDFFKNLNNSDKEKYKDYKFIHTGHSLGGGLAQCMAGWTRKNAVELNKELQIQSPFSETIGIGFSPRGSDGIYVKTLQIETEEAKEYIDNYVVPTDFVSMLIPQAGNICFESTLDKYLDDAQYDILLHNASEFLLGEGALLNYENLKEILKVQDTGLTSHSMEFHIDGYKEAANKGDYNDWIRVYWTLYRLLIRIDNEKL